MSASVIPIVATSQTSRFHTETLSTLSTELDLKDVTISIGGTDVLVDAHLRLKAGVHYALVGRNGQGKSTLLKAIADKIIPGIPQNLLILLVDQVEGSSPFLRGNVDSQATVTQRVVDSDRRRLAAVSELDVLTKAFESTAVDDLASAVASIKLERSKAELEEAQNIALRRSGARGAEARKQLLKAEAKVSDDQKRRERALNGEYSEDVAEEASSLLLDVQSTLDSLDASATEANARSILVGLGFSQEQLDAPFTSLSGGWRSRCTLASALLQKPDILLLDEPTNFLDLQSIIWLQNLCSVVRLRNQKLSYFEGNLSQCELNEKKVRKGLTNMQDAMDRKKQAIEKSIDDGKRTAKKTGDENRARMVKSRQKKLEERWGLERSDKGTRYNRDFKDYQTSSLNNRRNALVIEDGDPPISLIFPEPEPLRFPGSLISASNIAFRYSAKTKTVIQDINLTIHPGSRTGLLGLNGMGKSTLVKVLIGSLKPSQGTIERHPRASLGYYAQHSVEELCEKQVASLPALQYMLEKLTALGTVEINESMARACLGSFGLHGKTVTVPLGNLSGGQKVRLALALVVYPAPDLLVLDEVSTHLDLDTINALIQALRRYKGAILLVSHDRHLMKSVVEGDPILASDSDEDTNEEEGEDLKTGSVYMVGVKGTLKLLKGTEEYVQLITKRMRKQGLVS
ncbi:P-loop containing nucleoside triphosphate hydrolase protein [Mycena floridula]|nr:P-loop containing nucleoside triphosphate hydrolase protein [Mycena floridula]